MPRKIRISFAFTVGFNSFLHLSKVPTESEICPENQGMRGEYNVTNVFTLEGFWDVGTIPMQKRMNEKSVFFT